MMVRRRLDPVSPTERIHDLLTLMPNRLQFSTASRRSYFFWYRRSGSVIFVFVSEYPFAIYIKPRVQSCIPSLYNSTNLDVSTSYILSFPRLHACYLLDLRSALYCMASHRIHHAHCWISDCACGLSAVRGVNYQRFNNITTAYSVCFVFDYPER